MRCAKLLLGPLALADVAVDAEIARDVAVFRLQRDGAYLHLGRSAVLAGDGHFTTPAAILRKLSAQLGALLLTQVQCSHLVGVQPDRLRRVPAVKPLGSLVPGGDDIPLVRRDDRVLAVLEKGAEVREAFMLARLFGDVAGDRDSRDDSAAVAIHRPAAAPPADTTRVAVGAKEVFLDDLLTRAERPRDLALRI